MYQFIDGIYNPDIYVTSGDSLNKRAIELKDINKVINLDIWDIAGLIQCKTLAINFYNYVNVIILCYDSTNKFSFEELKD